MKFFRYRKPSAMNLLGYSQIKRRAKRALFISQTEAWAKPSRIKQKVKYEAGLYSAPVRALRQTSKGIFPTFLGLFRKK